MRNWNKWRAGAKARSERASRAARARWDRVHAAQAADPVLQSRVVELTIVDTNRMRRVIRLQAEPAARGWGRWLVNENGRRVGQRRFGAKAIAAMIAGSLT